MDPSIMSNHSENWQDELPFFPQEYRASPRVLPGSDEARAITVGSGRQLSKLLDQSSPLGAFSKILLESSVWTNSTEYCYVWDRLDTPFGLSAFQLTPLGQSTCDSEFSLWPTPTMRDWKDGTAQSCQNVPVNGLLGRAVHQLWPTPQAHDAAKGNSERVGRFGTKHGGRNLNDEVATKGSGSLSPRFVEQLMGYEIDHTALERSETPLSQRKRSRSFKRSTKSKQH
jgi:hypothetical protein